jgi:TetR/AcrR family transcriptional regulator, regulator of cefoperazone and chloramphenicol sensitivity
MTLREQKDFASEINEENTRDKILNAAGEVFAERGFEGATVRAITERAGVNIAAINYHFRDKSELYTRVVMNACAVPETLREAMMQSIESPEKRIRSLVFIFLRYLLDPARPAWKRKLTSREFSTPSAALDELVEHAIRPLREEFLMPTVNELTGGRLPRRQLCLISSSIMGQCLYYLQNRPMIDRLIPHFKIGKSEITEIAEHITRFSLAGITELARQVDHS